MNKSNNMHNLHWISHILSQNSIYSAVRVTVNTKHQRKLIKNELLIKRAFIF